MQTHYKVIMITTLISLSAGSSTAFAAHQSKHKYQRQSFTDTAKVTSATPIYRTVHIAEPREECYQEVVRQPRYRGHDSATPMIAGGVIGGILGNQFGKGNGKTFMTIAGTVLGGSIGRDVGMENRHRGYSSHTETHCNVVNDYREDEQLDGYRVTYRYHGEQFTTTMPYDPGNRMKIKVSIKPYE